MRYWVCISAYKGVWEVSLRCLIVSLGKSSSAAIERLVQQTEALVGELGEDGGPGAFVNVQKDFLQ